MRRMIAIVAVCLCVALVAAGCGKKNADSIVKDLDRVVGKLASYEGIGTMKLNTGQEALQYHVEVWYQNPHYYRISLTNEKKDITQIVLRNDEGVFVLTPHLNKMFRFQSDWPDNSGQVYLYQSLVQSILMDQQRQLVPEKETYVFDVAANYQNDILARQKVWLDKKTYAPRHVEVSDKNNQVLVTVDFTHFEFDKKFEKTDFDMQRNMTSWNLQSLPAMSPLGPEHSSAPEAAPPAAQQSEHDSYFGVILPTYVPEGVQQHDITEMKLGENQAVVIRYAGTYNYSLLEVRPREKTVTSLTGQILDLGFTLGIVTGNQYKTLTWTSAGVEFRLSTENLPQAEMIRIAQSVQGQMAK